MKKLSLFFLIILIFVFSFSFLAKDKITFQKVLTNDDYNFIDANRIKMWVSNNGDGSHDPATDGNGLHWAEGSAVFEDGLLWGCKIGNDIYVNGNNYRQGLQAGKIFDDGTADDPKNPKYRIYKIYRYWRDLQPGPLKDAYQKDYEEWPVEDGAPWIDVDGNDFFDPDFDSPELIGDQMLWFVSNDLDQERSVFAFGSLPIGIEIQTKVFAFNNPGILGDVVFKNYRVINKSKHILDSTFFSYWSDPDLGGASDDFVGCDTLLDLAFCYNADDNDTVYDEPVPAVGYTLLRDFVNNMTSFIFFKNNNWHPLPPGSSLTAQYYYNFSKGLIWNGSPFIDPTTGLATTFMVPGDPVAQTGWYEGDGWPDGPNPGDRRMMQSSGPYTVLPGDTIDIAYAISVRRGKNHLDSITELRKAAKAAHIIYANDFRNPDPPPVPVLNSYVSDRRINLYWENNAESFIEPDIIKESQVYNFEGYQVWQYSSPEGDDPRLLVIFDKKNDFKILNDYQTIHGILNDVTVFNLPNTGLQRSFNVTYDQIRDERVRNGSPYYFAVTAFAYSDSSFPRILESEPQIITVIPGDERIDINYTHSQDDQLLGKHITGDADGKLFIEVIDPDILTDHTYNVFVDTTDSIFWTLIDSTSQDTLFFGNLNFSAEFTQANVFDGLKFTLQDEGKDSLHAISGKDFGVKSVVQVEDASGPLESQLDLINSISADGSFSVTSYGPESIRENINANSSDVIGYANYEIRFTTEEEGSEYYLYGYQGSFRGPVTRDPKAENKVPLQIWNVGRDLNSTDDDVRLKVKIRDNFLQPGEEDKFVRDSLWSQSANGNWEAIYGYLEVDSSYHDGLDPVSGRDNPSEYYLHNFVIKGELPEPGTIIRIIPWRPLEHGNVFSIKMSPAIENDYAQAKERLDEISVFPNPYYGSVYREGRPGQGFIRIINLPQKLTIRIYTIAGELALKAEKDNASPWWDWNLRNQGGVAVASGIYIIHLDMPRIGTKVLKAAVAQDNYTTSEN